MDQSALSLSPIDSTPQVTITASFVSYCIIPYLVKSTHYAMKQQATMGLTSGFLQTRISQMPETLGASTSQPFF